MVRRSSRGRGWTEWVVGSWVVSRRSAIWREGVHVILLVRDVPSDTRKQKEKRSNAPMSTREECDEKVTVVCSRYEKEGKPS